MKNLRHAYVRILENTNETQQIFNVWKLIGYDAKENTHMIFSRQLEELEIINISRDLVAYFAKKFVNHCLKLNLREKILPRVLSI